MDEPLLMQCGHAANSTWTNAPGGPRPACVICGGPESHTPVEKPSLEGRLARCTYAMLTGKHKSPRYPNSARNEAVPSDWKLAFFEYRGPGSKRLNDYDEYYDGCFGWD